MHKKTMRNIKLSHTQKTTKFLIAVITLLTWLVMIHFSNPVLARPEDDLLVFLKTLPKEALYPSGYSAQYDLEDKRNKTLYDKANGYIKIEPWWLDGAYEIAIFKAKTGVAVIAINIIGCGPVCTTESLQFWRQDNQEWKNVTKEVLPKVTEQMLQDAYKRATKISSTPSNLYLLYILPRYGTTITLQASENDCDDCPKIIKFVWRKKNFTIES